MNRTGLIAALALVALAGVCGAAIINVPDDQATIQAGINAAGDGDTVLVAPGIYEENITTADKGNITIGSLTLMTGDSTYINETVIDGGGNGATVDIRRMQMNQELIHLCSIVVAERIFPSVWDKRIKFIKKNKGWGFLTRIFKKSPNFFLPTMNIDACQIRRFNIHELKLDDFC